MASYSSRQAAACSAVVSSAVTMSSGPKLTRASGGGLSGMGCVGEYCSPGTSPAGTGRSSTPCTGSPVSRFRMNMKPDLPTCATAGIRSPSRSMSSRPGAGGRL